MVSIRMLVIAPLAATVAGCGFVEADPSRFERWAEGVAAVPVSYQRAGLRGPIQSAQAIGLRGPIEAGRRTPMRIEVVEPEVLWAARADGFQSAAEATGQVVAEAVVHEAVAQAPEIAERVVRVTARTVQLGAFSSRSAAEAAWTRLSGHAALVGVAPRYEEIQRDGRTLVRLRASVEASRAQAACQAAGAGDYCASTGAS